MNIKECDIIMLSNTKSHKELEMTQNALNSLLKSEDLINFNIILVETNYELKTIFPRAYEQYHNLRLIIPNEEFNFNRFVNLAIANCQNPLIGILNNDVVFEPLWLSKIITAMNDFNLDSASSFCPEANTHKGLENKISIGWNVSREFSGWCIVLKREALNKILPLDEQFKFWCVDNDMAMSLSNLNLKHALIGDSIVHHLGGQTLFTQSDETISHLTGDMVKLFTKKYKK